MRRAVVVVPVVCALLLLSAAAGIAGEPPRASFEENPYTSGCVDGWWIPDGGELPGADQTAPDPGSSGQAEPAGSPRTDEAGTPGPAMPKVPAGGIRPAAV